MTRNAGHRPPAGLTFDLIEHAEKAFISAVQPRFGWMVNGGMPGPAQTAFQIRVASGYEELGEFPDIWDTGKIESSQSINVEYGGPSFSQGSTYFWTVRTWASGQAESSDWGPPQKLTVATTSEPTSYYPLETKAIAPVAVEFEEGIWRIDFGRAAFGWLEIEGLPGTGPIWIAVEIGEKRDGSRIDRSPGGTIRYATSRLTVMPGWQRVPLTADLRNTGRDGGHPDCRLAVMLPESIGVIMPFRYAEIKGLHGDYPLASAVRMVRVQYPFDETAARFSSPDATLNKIWDLCHHTILATTFAGIYVDGDRERIPYEGDAYINQLSHYAVDREFSMARRTHEYLLSNPTWPTEWKQHSILIAWADYEATGDSRSLARSYECLRDQKLLFQHVREDGLLDSRELRDLVDWPDVERDHFDFKPVNTVVNAFHFRTLVLMERIASALGRSADAGEFCELAGRHRERFNEVFFDEERGFYRDGEGSSHASLHANLFALAFDVVPGSRKKGVAAFLKRRGLVCSVYAAQFLLEGLFLAGEDDYAVSLMTARGLRGWWNMLQQGATMTWEAWDLSLKPNLDWNHAWGAAPGNIIARYVLGVQPVEPGYGVVKVSPQLGPLSWAEGTVPTIRGPIHVRAARGRSGDMSVDVKVPANVVLLQ